MKPVLTKLEPASPQTKPPAQYTKVAAILKILTLRPIDPTQSSLFNKTTQWIALKRRYLVDNTLINKSLPSRCNQACMKTVMLSATPMDRSDLSSVWQLSLPRSTRRSQTTADAWARTGSWYQCRRRPNSGYWTRRIPADQNHRRYTMGTYFDSSWRRWQRPHGSHTQVTDTTITRHREQHRLTAPVLFRGWLLSTRDGRGRARHSDSSRLRWHTTE